MRSNMRRTITRSGGQILAVALLVGVLGAAGAQPASAAVAQTNLALGGVATQSSTYAPTTTADKAIDGDSDGVLGHVSVTHTGISQDPWWQVDLGAPHAISDIEIFNRTDCCIERLTNAYVFTSNTPFDTRLDPATQATRPGVVTKRLTSENHYWFVRFQGIDTIGRYVMVQAPGWALFSLAEVRVLGTGALPDVLSLGSYNGYYLGVGVYVNPRYFTHGAGYANESTHLRVVANPNGTVRLQSTYTGGYIRLLDGDFVTDGNGDPNDASQNFTFISRSDGRASLRMADGRYWLAGPERELTVTSGTEWLAIPGAERYSMFGVTPK
jgi:hypothetical protein